MEKPIVYIQDADGNERTLPVTETDPFDGTYCAHMDDQGQAWIRIVPVVHPENRLNGVIEACLNHSARLDHEPFLQSLADSPTIEQKTTGEIFRAIESFITEELAHIKPAQE